MYYGWIVVRLKATLYDGTTNYCRLHRVSTQSVDLSSTTRPPAPAAAAVVMFPIRSTVCLVAIGRILRPTGYGNSYMSDYVLRVCWKRIQTCSPDSVFDADTRYLSVWLYSTSGFSLSLFLSLSSVCFWCRRVFATGARLWIKESCCYAYGHVRPFLTTRCRCRPDRWNSDDLTWHHALLSASPHKRSKFLGSGTAPLEHTAALCSYCYRTYDLPQIALHVDGFSTRWIQDKLTYMQQCDCVCYYGDRLLIVQWWHETTMTSSRSLY